MTTRLHPPKFCTIVLSSSSPSVCVCGSGALTADEKYRIFMRHRYTSCVKTLLEHLDHELPRVRVSPLLLTHTPQKTTATAVFVTAEVLQASEASCSQSGCDITADILWN